MSINDYVLKIKTIGHSLAAIRKPLRDKDLLLAILNGLDHEYETIVSLITYQMDDIDLEKVQFLLLMHEQRLTSKNLSHSSINVESIMPSSIHVNMTTYTLRGKREEGRGRETSRRIYCQLCGKPGHFVNRCYHHFDRNFQRNFASMSDLQWFLGQIREHF